jgi:hypothetical protein
VVRLQHVVEGVCQAQVRVRRRRASMGELLVFCLLFLAAFLPGVMLQPRRILPNHYIPHLTFTLTHPYYLPPLSYLSTLSTFFFLSASCAPVLLPLLLYTLQIAYQPLCSLAAVLSAASTPPTPKPAHSCRHTSSLLTAFSSASQRYLTLGGLQVGRGELGCPKFEWGRRWSLDGSRGEVSIGGY